MTQTENHKGVQNVDSFLFCSTATTITQQLILQIFTSESKASFQYYGLTMVPDEIYSKKPYNNLF